MAAACHGAGIRSAGLRMPAGEDVRIDHRGADVPVTEQFLHGPDVVAVLEEMSRERMAERVTERAAGDAGPADGILDDTLARVYRVRSR